VTALVVAGASVVLGGTRIVQDVDLVVPPGQWVGIIGPNGAGKTTLLRAVLGLLPLSAGTIEVLGRPVGSTARAQLARLMAWVPQRPLIPPDTTVSDYVLLGRTPHIAYLAGESREDHAWAAQAMAALDLTGMADRRLDGISGGELQRVVLARAMAQAAPVLVLDEPTSALDLGHQQQVLDLVDRMRRESGLTVVSALHDLTLAAQFCDRIILMSGGSVAADGRAPDVLTGPLIERHFDASVKVLDDGRGGVVVIPVRHRPPGTLPTAIESIDTHPAGPGRPEQRSTHEQHAAGHPTATGEGSPSLDRHRQHG
jgi:iron complex transport system ATP-binding protein